MALSPQQYEDRIYDLEKELKGWLEQWHRAEESEAKAIVERDGALEKLGQLMASYKGLLADYERLRQQRDHHNERWSHLYEENRELRIELKRTKEPPLRRVKGKLTRQPRLDAETMRDRLKELFHYEPKQGCFLWKRGDRGARKVGSRAGYINSGDFVEMQIDGAIYLAHRLVWLMHHDDWPPMLFHIDGDRTNNRIDNLRPARDRRKH